MTQTKIYPSTQAQVQAVQDAVDEINSKIVTPTYQVKTVTPSDVQQIVQADNGYNALHSVTVEPIAAAMPENLEAFIMNTAQEPYSLSLSGTVPAYACYDKMHLKRVYGNPLTIGSSAFSGCAALQSINLQNATTIGSSAFSGCAALQSVTAPNLFSIGNNTSYIFYNCSLLESVDLRGLTSIGSGSNTIFNNCANLKYVDLRNLINFTGVNQFYNSSSLILIDFTNVFTAPSLGNVNSFLNTNNSWIAVVANDTVKAAFQSATNWSTYASHIKTVAEVEAEVGMTYDEYYLQCFGHPRFDQ